ncbi:hypothetical protein GK107_01770 [Geobacillus thermoleovorans]|uniref:hypothetical protein n=1 Tax=Geobacillus thermoleovorans TaxID=33941 RepID=UPI00206C1ED4|nr:hypothetical protein [Geobacillus thermoleovorans]UPT58335.1 hypothetical protein GK107_01770 [Geobacillus thermoleovorans]
MKKSVLLSPLVALSLICTSGVSLTYAESGEKADKVKLQMEQEMDKKQLEERQEIRNLINEPVDQGENLSIKKETCSIS